MKKYLIAVLLLPLAWSCATEDPAEADKQNGELLRLTEELRALKAESDQKDSTMNALFTTFNEIEDNLVAIYDAEGNISEHTLDDVELQPTAKDRITAEIQAINELMNDNKAKIASLRKRLKSSKLDVVEFEKLVVRLEEQLSAKDVEIESLRKNLADLNIEMELLYSENEALIDQVEDQIDMMNQSFYSYGTSKELKTEGVITKEGGFIGIGRMDKLRADFNKEYFTEIDRTVTKEILLNSKKAKLVTSHPEDSYELVMKDDMVNKLVIKDIAAFWGVSKYLVIVID